MYMGIYIRVTVQIHGEKWKIQCARGPQDHPQIQWFPSRTHKTQYIVVLAAMIYYKRMQNQINERKKYMEWSSKETKKKQVQSSKSLLPVESNRVHLIPPTTIYDNMGEMLFIKEAY